MASMCVDTYLLYENITVDGISPLIIYDIIKYLIQLYELTIYFIDTYIRTNQKPLAS